MYKIIIKNKEQKEVSALSEYAPGEEITIGQGASNHIVIEDPSISAEHCSVSFQGGRIWIRNLKSRNGVIINGERLKKERAVVQDTDQVAIGDFQVVFVPDTASGIASASTLEKKSPLLPVIYCLVLAVGVIGFLAAFRPKPDRVLVISDLEPLAALKNADASAEAAVDAAGDLGWQLAQAKDAYFNNDILGSAKLFRQVLSSDAGNTDAVTYLAQIKNEVVPKLVKEIQSYLEERNIVSCAKTVEELKVIDPDNEMIARASGLLQGYDKFQKVRDLFDAHRFKEAWDAIQTIVLVDEEMLSDWKRKIGAETVVTEAFRSAMQKYRSGDLTKAMPELRKFTKQDTLQKNLQTVARDAIKAIRKYNYLVKLENKDPVEQLNFGIPVLYSIDEKQDPFIYTEVKKRMTLLKKECGPGADFYSLLVDDTKTNLEQALQYRAIKEVRDALKNYHSALKGERILAFLSNDSSIVQRENRLSEEIKKYHDEIRTSISSLSQVGEEDEAKKMDGLLSKYVVDLGDEETVIATMNAGTGDDQTVLQELLKEAPAVVSPVPASSPSAIQGDVDMKMDGPVQSVSSTVAVIPPAELAAQSSFQQTPVLPQEKKSA